MNTVPQGQATSIIRNAPENIATIIPQEALLKPWWKSRTNWATVLAFVLALPTFVEQIAPFLNEDQRKKAMALSALAAAVAAVYARKGGVEAAKAVGAGIELRNPDLTVAALPPGNTAGEGDGG